MTATVSWAEVAWIAMALTGIALNGWYCARAVRRQRQVYADPAYGRRHPLGVAAYGRVWRHGLRALCQVIFLVAGLIAAVLPTNQAGGTGPALIAGCFILNEVLIIFLSWHDERVDESIRRARHDAA